MWNLSRFSDKFFRVKRKSLENAPIKIVLFLQMCQKEFSALTGRCFGGRIYKQEISRDKMLCDIECTTT